VLTCVDGPPSLGDGVARDLLAQLGFVRDDAYPADDGLRERDVFRREEVRLKRSDHDHAPAIPRDV